MDFIFYRNSELIHTINRMRILLHTEYKRDESKKAPSAERVIAELFELASQNGYAGNLWHCLLTDALINDVNPYTLSVERRNAGGGTLRMAALTDLEIFHRLYRVDLDVLAREYRQPAFSLLQDYAPAAAGSVKYDPEIVEELRSLSVSLAEARDATTLRERLEDFYREFGVGDLGLHKAFRLKGDEGSTIAAIHNIEKVTLDTLVGYDDQKKALTENTESFLRGGGANNCLLYGEAGTGKSTSIRAILNAYYDRGLRIIEVYKHQYKYIKDLIDKLRMRNYRFILYLDDLSFEEFEVEYKYLKAVIEGGLDGRPSNVLIYATSNRRHLVRESFDDRPESPLDKHKNETVQEKISLYSRFGVTIYYPSPARKAYLAIVEELAARCGIDMPKEELHLRANSWELSHSGLSGRTAQQFIDNLKESING
ncbi:MAG: ATP-binding protein [Lachnospiraceae bacterium]|nr:ATP-binding protein [Lachnospiraceae bacterium]